MVVCPRCGTSNPPESVFCNRCGTRLSTEIQNKSFHPGIISVLKKYSIPIGALVVIIILGLSYRPGEQDPCKDMYCQDVCRGTELWKMKCVEGKCVPNYPLEKESATCGYTPPPSSTPEPTDFDNDSVPDYLDACTNVGCTLVDSRGCPLDADGDGVQDCDDKCPNSSCNIIDSQGCPLDSDGDGVQDCDDECLQEKGERRNKGCPVSPPAIVKIKIDYVNFNPPGNDNDDPNGEWVKIVNKGTVDVDMSGWKLYDQAYLWKTARDHVLIFPSKFILKAGQSVIIYTGKGINSKTELYFGRSPGDYGAIWNNDGDCAFLEDNTGNLIDTYCW